MEIPAGSGEMKHLPIMRRMQPESESFRVTRGTMKMFLHTRSNHGILQISIFFRKEYFMDMSVVKEKAKLLGVKAARKNNVDLIKSIQQAEGNFPCFKTASGSCDQQSCLWRTDCLSSK
jgi:hypothetical protein